MGGELRKLFPECRASASVQMDLLQVTHIKLQLREAKKEHPGLVPAARLEIERYYVAARYASGTDLMREVYCHFQSELAFADTLVDEENRDFVAMMAISKLLADLDELVFESNNRSYKFCEDLISEMSALLQDKQDAQAQIAGPPPPRSAALSIEAPPAGIEGIDW